MSWLGQRVGGAELGIGQARALGEQLQAGVVRDRHVKRTQHLLHGAERSWPPSACTERRIQLDSGLALTHVSSLTCIVSRALRGHEVWHRAAVNRQRPLDVQEIGHPIAVGQAAIAGMVLSYLVGRFGA